MDVLFHANTMGIAGLAIGLVGIVLAILFYERSRRLKQPQWQRRTINLIKGLNPTISDLEMVYKGQAVENLSVTALSFWNAGRDTIDQSDVVRGYPVTISSAKEARILDVRQIATTNDASRIGVDEATGAISFEYLDKGDGALFQVIHTGLSDDDIAITGKIKSVSSFRLSARPILTDLREAFKRESVELRNRAFSYVCIGIAFALLASTITDWILWTDTTEASWRWDASVIGGVLHDDSAEVSSNDSDESIVIQGSQLAASLFFSLIGIMLCFALVAVILSSWLARVPREIDVYRTSDAWAFDTKNPPGR